MTLRLRYFASIREALGSGESFEPAEGMTVAQVRDALIARGGAHAAALGRSRAVRTALDQVLCDEAALVPRDAEIAFFPPVTGG